MNTYTFWTDGGDQDNILARSLNEAAEIASHKIPVSCWNDGAWGWVRGEDGAQMRVPSRGVAA